MNGTYLKVVVLAEQVLKGHSEVCSFRGSDGRTFETCMFTGPKASMEKEIDERHYGEAGKVKGFGSQV